MTPDELRRLAEGALRATRRAAPAPAPKRRPGRPSHEDRLAGSASDEHRELATARLRKELALAQRHELQNRIRRGELVEARAVIEDLRRLGAVLRRAAARARQRFGEDAEALFVDALEQVEAEWRAMGDGDGRDG